MLDGIDRLVLIRLAGKRIALDLGTISEVAELSETWPIPMAPPFFKGVMNSHGRLVPLLDLASYLGSGSTVSGGKTLLLDRILADLALWVDDVEKVVPSFGAAFLRDGQAPASAILEIDGDEVPLISSPLLVEMLEADLRLLMQAHFAPLEEMA